MLGDMHHALDEDNRIRLCLPDRLENLPVIFIEHFGCSDADLVDAERDVNLAELPRCEDIRQ